MKASGKRIGDIQDILKELDLKIGRLKKEKQVVEGVFKDSEEIRDILARVQTDAEQLLGQGHLIQETRQSVKDLEEGINDLKIESKNISVKNEMISGYQRSI